MIALALVEPRNDGGKMRERPIAVKIKYPFVAPGVRIDQRQIRHFVLFKAACEAMVGERHFHREDARRVLALRGLRTFAGARMDVA